MNGTASLLKIPSADGTRIAVERSGSGPSVVIVNGALSDRSSAAGLRPLLDPHLTVIAYDRRGRGDSGDGEQYKPEREMEDLAAVIDGERRPGVRVRPVERGDPRPGGGAARPPRQPAGHQRTAIHRRGSRRRPSVDLADRLRRLIDGGDREAATHLFMRDAVGASDEAINGLRSSPAWSHMLGLAHTLAYDDLVAGRYELPATECLQAFAVPTLVTRGGATEPWIKLGTETLAGHLPNARLVDLPGQGHSPAPDVLAEALLEFFAG